MRAQNEFSTTVMQEPKISVHLSSSCLLLPPPILLLGLVLYRPCYIAPLGARVWLPSPPNSIIAQPSPLFPPPFHLFTLFLGFPCSRSSHSHPFPPYFSASIETSKIAVCSPHIRMSDTDEVAEIKHSNGGNEITESLALAHADHTQTKDSPLTDIGTLPPTFDLPPLDEKRSGSKDSYESSELSDLSDDELEAETDKMDFLDDDANSGAGDKVSDLHALSDLTELARLQEVDSDDSDDEYVGNIQNAVSPPPFENGAMKLNTGLKREHEEELNDSKKPKTAIPDVPDDKDVEVKEENGQVEDDVSTGEGATGEGAIEHEDMHEEDENESLVDNVAESPTVDDSEKNTDPTAEPAENAEIQVLEKAQEVAQTRLSVEATSLAEDIEKDHERDSKKDESESEHSEMDSLDTDAEDNVEVDEADVEDVVKQEELDEQNEQEEAEAAEAASDDLANRVEDDEELDVDLDEHRKLAVDELISIEKDFAFLRDKLFHDKLGLLEHELKLCLDGSHPELLHIYYKVHEFYQDNIKLANSTLNYSLKCINNETIATRTAIHQDFLRSMMDMKNEMVTNTTSLWYKVNRERNSIDQVVPECNFAAIPTLAEDKATFGIAGGDIYPEGSGINKKVLKQNMLIELVQQRNSFNEQLGILNGLAEFHGIPSTVTTELMESGDFPAGELLLRKATSEEINDDLQAMGIY